MLDFEEGGKRGGNGALDCHFERIELIEPGNSSRRIEETEMSYGDNNIEKHDSMQHRDVLKVKSWG